MGTMREFLVTLTRGLTVSDSNATHYERIPSRMLVFAETPNEEETVVRDAALSLGAPADWANEAGVKVACGDWYHRHTEHPDLTLFVRF